MFSLGQYFNLLLKKNSHNTCKHYQGKTTDKKSNYKNLLLATHADTHTCTHTHRCFISWTRECPACTQATQKTAVNCAFVILLPPQGEMSSQCHCLSINIWLFCFSLVLTPFSGNYSYLLPVCHIPSALPIFCRYLCSMFLLFTIQRAVETRYQIYFYFLFYFLIP